MIPIRDDNPTRRLPVFVWLLVIANIAVFVYELSLPADALEDFVLTYGMVPARLMQVPASPDQFLMQLLSVFTSMFLHGSWLHLIGNIWILWLFGDNIEDVLGHRRFIVFYFTCGFLAALLHTVLYAASPVPTIGASGAIAGVMGAYFLLFPTARITMLMPVFFVPLFFKLPAFVYLLFWIILQLAGGYSAVGQEATGIAFWAHIGGFFAGMYLVRAWLKSKLKRRRRRKRYE